MLSMILMNPVSLFLGFAAFAIVGTNFLEHPVLQAAVSEKEREQRVIRRISYA